MCGIALYDGMIGAALNKRYIQRGIRLDIDTFTSHPTVNGPSPISAVPTLLYRGIHRIITLFAVGGEQILEFKIWQNQILAKCKQFINKSDFVIFFFLLIYIFVVSMCGGGVPVVCPFELLLLFLQMPTGCCWGCAEFCLHFLQFLILAPNPFFEKNAKCQIF